MSWTSTPASISSAASRCAAALVFSYMNRPVSVTSATYNALAISGVISRPEQLRELEDDLGGAGGISVDEVQGAESGVVVVVVDVEDHGVVALQEVHGHAVDVPAVEEDDHPVHHVDRGLVEDLLEGQEPVLDGQRELLRREEHDRVLAELLEDLVHRQQRSERIPVRALVSREQEPIAGTQRPRHVAEGSILRLSERGYLTHARGAATGGRRAPASRRNGRSRWAFA